MKLHQDLISVLKKDDRLVVDGKLAKNKVIELALQLDVDLLKLLRSSKDLSKTFFQQVDDIVIFDKVKFQSFVSNKQFLPDSFTEYKNKIGLVSDKQYLTDNEEVVLAFPYKDCVLEGGQTKEDTKRDEVFWNETLATDEIDKLLEPKVFTNLKKYDSKGEHPAKDFLLEDNLIIKGNNLMALHSLKKTHKGKVKLIYIDPPYNTGTDTFKYNDSFNHSTWLTFMKNRLTIASTLLEKTGSIFVQCDDNEQAYVRVLLDEIFGRENFINLITVKTKIAGVSGSSEGGSFQDNCEYINFYSKSKEDFELANNIYERTELFSFIEEMKENDQSWKYTTVFEEVDAGEYIKSIPTREGSEIKIFRHKKYKFSSIKDIAKRKYGGDVKKAYYGEIENVFRTTNAQSSIRTRIMEEKLPDELISIEYVPTKGKNKGKKVKLFYKDEIRNLITRLSEVTETVDGVVYKLDKKGSLWDSINYNNISKEGEVKLENGKKPEELLYNIIYSATNEGDLVLDYHLGSGTTCAVAHKMKRRYIGIEQLDYGDNDSVIRLKNVIKGDQSGISKLVKWQSGGSFVYAELAKANQLFVDKIQDSKNTKELLKVWDEMKKKAFLSYKVKPEDIDATKKDFETLSFEDQQKFLIFTLDKNLLYVPYSEIEDKTYKVSKEDITLNNKFYGRD